MPPAYDIVIIGSGAGGGAMAYALRNTGARILLIERGDFLPQEPQNWDPEEVYFKNRYKPMHAC
jgi:choline dehydrogenase-like flavoprotein